MMFGWKAKADKLSMVIRSGAHQLAKELPPNLVRIIDMFRYTARTGDGSGLQAAIESLPPLSPEDRVLWEPAEIGGWVFNATMYLDNGQLWWLLHVQRKKVHTPSAENIAFLDRVVEHLGADPQRDMIIGPRSTPPGYNAIPFGWWTWFNRQPLFEIHVHEAKKDLRVVPLGSRETDGYRSLDVAMKGQQ